MYIYKVLTLQEKDYLEINFWLQNEMIVNCYQNNH